MCSALATTCKRKKKKKKTFYCLGAGLAQVGDAFHGLSEASAHFECWGHKVGVGVGRQYNDDLAEIVKGGRKQRVGSRYLKAGRSETGHWQKGKERLT